MNKRALVFPANEIYPETTVVELKHNCCFGSFNTVSKARLIPDGRIVAVKRTRDRVAPPPVYSFEQPAYVLQVLYRSEGDETTIIEEWAEGQTLDALFRWPKRNLDQLPCILLQVIEILRDLICVQRIYHADLTPRNILAMVSDEQCAVKLIDFDPWYPVDGSGLVKTDCISGSMPFIPPEHLLGDLVFDSEKAAVYCAGAIFHHLLLGYPPYCTQMEKTYVERLMFGPRDVPAKQAERIQREDFLAFRKHVEAHEVDAEKLNRSPIGKILLRMLNKHPARRAGFASAVRELEQIQRIEEPT